MAAVLHRMVRASWNQSSSWLFHATLCSMRTLSNPKPPLASNLAYFPQRVTKLVALQYCSMSSLGSISRSSASTTTGVGSTCCTVLNNYSRLRIYLRGHQRIVLWLPLSAMSDPQEVIQCSCWRLWAIMKLRLAKSVKVCWDIIFTRSWVYLPSWKLTIFTY